MKFVNYILLFIILFLVPTLSSCKDTNDEPQAGYPDPTIPENAIQLNMMNESNGKSFLGDTDVYLSDGNNFVSSGKYLIGKVTKLPLSFNAFPELNQLTPQIAVSPKNIYQIFPSENIHIFPSGIIALKDNTQYINAYVESWINRKKKKVGAKISFLGKLIHNDFPFGPISVLNSSLNPEEKIINEISFGKSNEIEIISVKPNDKNINIWHNEKRIVITTIGSVEADIEIYIRDWDVYINHKIHITPQAII